MTPTTLPCLPYRAVRNASGAALGKGGYYGGGTLAASDNKTGYRAFPADLAQRFEDGTVSFLRCELELSPGMWG
jgi:hypothetical protein